MKMRRCNAGWWLRGMLASVSLMSAISLVLSQWWWVQWWLPTGWPITIYTVRGAVGFIHGPRIPYNAPEGLHVGTYEGQVAAGITPDLQLHWWPSYESRPLGSRRHTEAKLPLWMIAFVSGGAWGWWKVVRKPPVPEGVCHECGYEKGGGIAVCPECGK